MGCSLVLYILKALNFTYNVNKLYKTFDCWSSDMLNFDFVKKSLGTVSPPHFVYDFLREMFLVFHSITWPIFIAYLPLVIEILYCKCLLTKLWRHKSWN